MIYDPKTGWTEPTLIKENNEMIDYVAKLQLANHHLNEAIGVLVSAQQETKSTFIKNKIERVGHMISAIREKGISNIIHDVSRHK